MNVPFVDLKAQYARIKGDVLPAIEAVLDRADFILGDALEGFEEAFARYCGTRYCVGVDNGTSALELSLRALGIGPGDEVITTTHTYIASVLPILYVGAKPVLVDCDPATYTITAAAAEAAITRRTAALLPVHFYGQPADMAPLQRLAERHGLAIVEDACQAHGASYRDVKAGALGTAAAFSFYPSKNLGGYGDGGAITTDDERLAEQARRLRNFGQRRKGEHEGLGWNHRLDNLQATVLSAKLPHLDGWNAERRRHAARYRELLGAIEGLQLPQEAEDRYHVYHVFAVHLDGRDDLREHLASRGVRAQLHYARPVHLEGALAELGHARGSFRVAERLMARELSLPMYPELQPAQIDHVAESVRSFVEARASAGA